MAGRARSQSMSAATMNTKAQLNTAYNELGKELSDSRIRVVGNYNIGRIIGEGAFGKVRLGTHRLTSIRVAIKQIPKAVSAQLTREIHHHRQLHHPHVAQLYEVIATESNIWLVTELCAGGELFDYLVEKGRIDEYEARIIFGQLCLAVGYVHDRGAVHRDLKLENVLLDERCRVKLGDFGFTREFEKSTLLDTFCGTIGYASPEMLLGQKYLGQEVDIWSLGIILYALLTGTLPFDDDDESVTKEKILTGTYEDPEWLSPEARDLIRSILVREPAKRPTLSQILAHSWFTVPLHPPTLPPEVTPFTEALAEEMSESCPPSTQNTRPPSPDQPALNGTSTPLSKKGCPSQENETPRPARPPSTPPPNPNASLFSSDGNTNIEADLSPRLLTERRESYQSNRVPSGSMVPPLPTRTPARTKRRSVSSTISPPGTPKQRPSSSAALPSTPVPDFLSAMQKAKSADVVFSTPVERELLNVLAALGFDTAQIVHSVLSDACDSAGAVWWMLRKKAIANGGLDLPDRNGQRQGPGLFNTGIFADTPVKKSKEKEPEKEREGEEEATWADPTYTEAGDARKKKRERDKDKDKDREREREREGGKDKRNGPPAGLAVVTGSGPDFALVPPTPVKEDISTGHVTPPVQMLSPTSLRTKSPPPPVFSLSTSTPSKLLPEKDKTSNSKARSGSISIMQRAQTVLGRKKSDEPLREKGSEEARLSTGSAREGGGKLTKSPPPGKRSGSGESDAPTSSWAGTPKGVGTPSGSAFSTKTTPVAGTPPVSIDGPTAGRRNGNASAPANLFSSPATLSAGDTPRPPFARHLSGSAGSGAVKARNRASLINTFKMWFVPDDGKRKRKVASSARGGTAVFPLGGANTSTVTTSPLPSPFTPPPPSSASSQRNYSSGAHGRKGKGAARRGRGHKDKRPSVSSRRSSSVNSRRSSVASMTPSAKGLAALREHQSESVISTSGLMGGVPLTRSRSDASRRSFGAQSPISEGDYEGSGLGHESQSRPSSLKSFGTPAPRRGGRKCHSKSSSASSADQVPTSASRPGSRAGTGSPLGRFHRRAGSGSSQTRVVRQVKPGTKAPKGGPATGHRRSGSMSSVRSHGSSAAEDVDMEVLLEEAGLVPEGEEPPLRSGTPSGKSRYSNTVLVAQKKHSVYGNPQQSIGRSSWKRAWGVEPPGWSSRATHATVIETIILDDRKSGHVRDVFAKGGGQADDGDEDDWEDEDDDVPFAGGVGQPAGLPASNSITVNGRSTSVEPAASSSPSFGSSIVGRRNVGKAPMIGVGSRINKANGSPVTRTASLPLVTPPTNPSGMETTTIGGRRAQLPQGRSGFKPATVVEEEEEEEED